MRKLISGITLTTMLLAGNLALGEDLVEVYGQALRNDPGIREAEANMMASFERKPQALAALLPQLSASGSWENRNDENVSLGLSSFLEGSGGVLSRTENDTDNWNARISLNQSLIDKSKWIDLKKADKEVARARADFESAQQELIARVAEAYFNVLAAQDSLMALQDAKNAFGRQLEQAERRFEVGLIAITDVKESQAAYDDAIASEIDAKRQLANSKEALREITGDYPEDLAAPKDEFPLSPPEPEIEQDWVDLAMQQNFALESAKLSADITRENVRSARSDHLPTLDLSGSVGTGENDGTRIDLVTLDETINRSERDSYNFGIQLNIPIFSGGGVSSRVQENVYLHRASRENYEKIARQTERETRDAYFGVISDITRVKALKRSVESNQTALEATEAGYNVGTRTTVDVLDAQRDLSQALTQYARSKYDYLFNVLKLKQAAGALSSSDVEELNLLFSDKN
ncbi:MAG: TolC family outer membrane protein [Pseudomonadota bacterium]|nr:TolC family outer membrane protein [Pseudomonadota bacterium]